MTQLKELKEIIYLKNINKDDEGNKNIFVLVIISFQIKIKEIINIIYLKNKTCKKLIIEVFKSYYNNINFLKRRNKEKKRLLL